MSPDTNISHEAPELNKESRIRRVPNATERKSMLSKLGKSLTDIQLFASSSDEEMLCSNDVSPKLSEHETTEPRRVSYRRAIRRRTMDNSQRLSSPNATERRSVFSKLGKKSMRDVQPSPSSSDFELVFSSEGSQESPNNETTRRLLRRVSRRCTIDNGQRLTPSRVRSDKKAIVRSLSSDEADRLDTMNEQTLSIDLEHSCNSPKKRPNTIGLNYDSKCPSPIRSPIKAFRQISKSYSKRWISPEDGSSNEFLANGNDPSVCTTSEDSSSANADPQVTFLALLNHINPKSNTTMKTRQEKMERQLTFQKVEALIKKHPKLCRSEYLFQAFTSKLADEDGDEDVDDEVYPLHFLSSVNAPVSTIQACYRAYEPAMQCNRSNIGSPLHYACYYGTSNDVIQFLIMKEPKNLARVNVDGRTPLLMACLNPNTKHTIDILSIVGMLSIKTDRADKYGNRPLHLVCSQTPTVEIVHLVVDVVKDFNTSAVNKLGQTPLHLAVSGQHADVSIVKVLLKVETKSAAPYITDKRGQTPLHVAVHYYGTKENNNYDKNIIIYLARKYPETLTVQDADGKTPADIATQYNLGTKMIKILTP